jgi:hypothetical protein
VSVVNRQVRSSFAVFGAESHFEGTAFRADFSVDGVDGALGRRDDEQAVSREPSAISGPDQFVGRIQLQDLVLDVAQVSCREAGGCFTKLGQPHRCGRAGLWNRRLAGGQPEPVGTRGITSCDSLYQQETNNSPEDPTSTSVAR